jgi:hypothetical protein
MAGYKRSTSYQELVFISYSALPPLVLLVSRQALLTLNKVATVGFMFQADLPA